MGTESAIAASPPTQRADVTGVLILVGFAVIAIVLPLAIALLAGRRQRRRLRRCPRCGSVAVREAVRDPVDSMLVQLRIECGQCGLWRRTAAGHRFADRLGRRLERDRRDIDAAATKAAASDIRAFLPALRSDVAGAGDFLALTRSTSRPPQGQDT